MNPRGPTEAFRPVRFPGFLGCFWRIEGALKKVNLACVVGARPNFVKIAPLLRALDQHSHLRAALVHTGQHWDASLSDVFLEELQIRRPVASLGVGSGSHAVQTARVLERMEDVLAHGAEDGAAYDRVVVVGDVNSTMAAAVAAVKLGLPVAHVEAGLRSFDRTMPEEINRLVTDTVSDLLFASEPCAVANLYREGHTEEQVYLVGNVMIDALRWALPRARQRDPFSRYGLKPSQYAVVTLHRPSNVDDPAVLAPLVDTLLEISRQCRLVFPAHPRTQSRLEQFGLASVVGGSNGIVLLPPLGYLDFLALTSQARFIITDSGGLQEESTALGIPCFTVRPNTERPITVTEGTNTVVGHDPVKLRQGVQSVLEDRYKQGRCPALWDGRAAERIAAVLADRHNR